MSRPSCLSANLHVTRPHILFVISAVLVLQFSVENAFGTTMPRFSDTSRRQAASGRQMGSAASATESKWNGFGRVKRSVESGLDAPAREYVELDDLAMLAANGASLAADLRRYVDVQQQHLNRLRRYAKTAGRIVALCRPIHFNVRNVHRAPSGILIKILMHVIRQDRHVILYIRRMVRRSKPNTANFNWPINHVHH
jgi:hypothetical protein